MDVNMKKSYDELLKEYHVALNEYNKDGKQGVKPLFKSKVESLKDLKELRDFLFNNRKNIIEYVELEFNVSEDTLAREVETELQQESEEYLMELSAITDWKQLKIFEIKYFLLPNYPRISADFQNITLDAYKEKLGALCHDKYHSNDSKSANINFDIMNFNVNLATLGLDIANIQVSNLKISGILPNDVTGHTEHGLHDRKTYLATRRTNLIHNLSYSKNLTVIELPQSFDQYHKDMAQTICDINQIEQCKTDCANLIIQKQTLKDKYIDSAFNMFYLTSAISAIAVILSAFAIPYTGIAALSIFGLGAAKCAYDMVSALMIQKEIDNTNADKTKLGYAIKCGKQRYDSILQNNQPKTHVTRPDPQAAKPSADATTTPPNLSPAV
jgi:hypothetical protein